MSEDKRVACAICGEYSGLKRLNNRRLKFR